MPIIENTAAEIFAEIMREERERRGLAADQLAEKLGLHHHVIKDWEEGRRTPRLGSALRWAQYLGFQFELIRPR
jgi:ribosome-binding protein aMBF1 (putative translation factor)